MKPLLFMLCASLFLAQVAHAQSAARAIVSSKDPTTRALPTAPEPGAMLVFGAGLLAVGIASRRKPE